MTERDKVKAELLDELLAASLSRAEKSRAMIASEQENLAREELLQSALRQQRGMGGRGSADRTAPSNGSAAVVGSTRVESGRIPQLIATALRQAGRALTVGELEHAVEELGGASDAKKGLKAILFSALGRRTDLFIRVDRGLYDLADRHKGRKHESGDG